LILSHITRNLVCRTTADPSPGKSTGMIMKSVIAAAIAIAGAPLASDAAHAEAARDTLRPCTARVIYSEELPFAPIDSWLIKVTLEITPRNGTPYYTILHDRMPWQGPPPRRGQAFRLWCDPADPDHLQLASGPRVKSAF
jgi:hypothetical protein